jgi:acetyl esterase
LRGGPTASARSATFEAAWTGFGPAALVITAEYDILRDEGWRFAERLRQAGVAVTHHHYATAIHGFFSMPGLFPEGRAAMTEASDWLKDRFSVADLRNVSA